MKINLFNPIESKNPIYLGNAGEQLYQEVLELHGSQTRAEVKEDGYRMQVHKQRDQIKAFTRSKNEFVLELFPELYQSLLHLPDCIIDAELIGEDKIGHEGFKAVKKRFRSRISAKGIDEYLASDLKETFPLSLRVFDTLYWNDQELIDQPLELRRIYTEKIQEPKIIPSTSRIINSSDRLQNWFETLVGSNYEGLVCKNPRSFYAPGSSDNDWIKIKRAETLDLAVLGVYLEDGAISQLLCGTYNSDKKQFETLAKVNAKRNHFQDQLQPLLQKNYISECPTEIVLNPVIHKQVEHLPTYFIQPSSSLVVEVAAMNFQRSQNWHSCDLENKMAYSLRIGWLKDIREDKNPYQANTTERVKLLYQQEIEPGGK